MGQAAKANAELIVVGAGPGGSVAASALARSGRQVLLLEACSFPRDKVCGDVLLPQVDLALCAIGTSLAALASDAREIHGCAYTTTRGRRVVGNFCDLRGFLHFWRVLPRRVFDQRLALHAVSQGAVLREQHRVTEATWDARAGLNRLTVDTPAGTVELSSPLVVGADGAAGPTARSRGLGASAPGSSSMDAVAYRGYVPWSGKGSHCEVIASKRLLPGCAWILPGPEGRANVGVGLVAAHRRDRDLRLREELERLLGGRVALDRLEGGAGWSLPGSFESTRTVADGLLLVGDAAGLVDPFTGLGIHNACASALLAAEAADGALASGELLAEQAPLAGYAQQLEARFGPELQWGRRLQRFHSKPLLVELALLGGANSRRVADRLMGLAGHALNRSRLSVPRLLLDLVQGDADWPPSRPAP